jgi:enoyl-CoA hydratase/carnithine racemase
LTFPFPTICSINGLCEGGANIIALCHDYRILDGQAGVMSFDAIHLGAHFVGIAGIIRHKLTPQAARKMALEGYRFSAQDALADGVVDKLAASDKQEETAITLAREVAPLGKHGSYGLMRKELLGDVVQKLLWSCQ